MVGPRRQEAVISASEPSLRSPERQALAEAIAKAEEHNKGLAACRAAIQAAEGMEATAEAALRDAQAEVEQAKASRAAEITAAAAAGQSVPSSDRQRLARQREVEAQDELEAVRSSLEAVRAPLSDWEYWAQNCAEKVRKAAADVATAQVPEAIAVALRAIKNAEVCVRSAYAAHSAVTDVAGGQDQAMSARINALLNFVPGTWDYRNPSRGDGPEWNRAVAALLTDPDAPLPAVREVADMVPGEPGPGITGPRRVA